MRPYECKYCSQSFIIEDEESDKIKIICPHCGIDFCNKTETERDLFQFQDRYIKKEINVDKFIEITYNLLKDYCQSMILSNFSYRLKEPGALEYYSTQAIHYFYPYFLIDENFIVKTSFSGLLYHKITQSFNEKSNMPTTELSLNHIFEDDNEVQYEDETKDCLESIEEYEDKIYLYKYLLKIIYGIEHFCNDKRENFLRLMALHHYLKFGEKKVDALFQNYTKYGKLRYEKTLEILHSELKRLHSEN